MRLVRTLLVGAAATVLTANGAAADWNGFHVGLHSGAAIIFGGGLQAGFDFQRGNLVFGVEGRFGTLLGAGPPPLLYVGAGGKIGVAMGPGGNVLIYGTGAYGRVFQGGIAQPFFVFGTGAEFAVNDRLSWFAEIDGLGIGGGAGTCCIGIVTGGVNFRFGN